MITSIAIEAAKTLLNQSIKVHVLGTDDVFPTAGKTFIRVYGVDTEIIRHEQYADFTVKLGITSYQRNREHPIQNKSIPYLELLNISEQIVFYLLVDQTIVNAIRQEHPTVGVFGVPRPYLLSTEPKGISPSVFGSSDLSSKREAGYSMTIYFTLPTVRVPIQCFELSQSFQNA